MREGMLDVGAHRGFRRVVAAAAKLTRSPIET
jgi:hypothetical protein